MPKNAVIHRGYTELLPRAVAPQISKYVTVTWQWTDQSNGDINWIFTNNDPSNSHAVVLYRGATSDSGGGGVGSYIFGGAFWPIYLGPDDSVSHMLDGSQALPTLSGSGGGQPMGLLDFGASASPRYLVAFIFNIAAGATFTTPEQGFTGLTPTAGACYELVSNVTGNYCVGYDPQRVIDFDNQEKDNDRGYSPNPSSYFTYAFTPEAATPEVTLGYNDSIAAGSCATQNFYFTMEQNTFGRDEVADNFSYPLAFYLFLDGFTPNAVGSSLPTFSGSFNPTSIPGLTNFATVTPSIKYDLGNTGSLATVPQRIRFGYPVDFTSASLAKFPPPGSTTPATFTLKAAISVQGVAQTQTPTAEFYLLGGDDPYFANVNAPANNPYYLSQDLRVFTATPAVKNKPVEGPGAPTLTDSVDGAYEYIGKLIAWLNSQIGYQNAMYTPPDTDVTDPLDTLFLDQESVFSADSSVTPKSGPNKNYNFAIARVRLKGASGPMAAAKNVRVFFRLMTTQTFDTDYINIKTATTSADPNVTYPSTGSLNDPQSPLPGTNGSGGVNGCSLPFFATANYDNSPTDYNSGGANNQTITIPSGQDYAWAFYGCFLNVYDNNNLIDGQPVQFYLAGSAHSCLVAQIAYTDAPIINAGGVIENPSICDKLAQRNLQIGLSGNPGYPATHLVPQTIDVRPSPPAQSADPTSILSYPDEMMIDWGSTPPGSVVSIYWPAVSSSAVLSLASQLYPQQTLTAADANTIQCTVGAPVTYIPIPPGTGGSFAGLFSAVLPPTVRYGQQYDIVVRRITTKQIAQATPPPPPPQPKLQANATIPDLLLWRYITGSFLVRISVQEESGILPVDENLLAVLKWRLGLIGPGNRWYPVLLRWISYLSNRINGMGGNASQIPGSPNGYQAPGAPTGGEPVEVCYTGKVTGLLYDHCGEFQGFELCTGCGATRSFSACECADDLEDLIYRAWLGHFVITVCLCEGSGQQKEHIASVTLRRAPRPSRP